LFLSSQLDSGAPVGLSKLRSLSKGRSSWRRGSPLCTLCGVVVQCGRRRRWGEGLNHCTIDQPCPGYCFNDDDDDTNKYEKTKYSGDVMED